jgi:glutamyl-tRNA reductase
LEQLPDRLLTADLVFVATSAGRQILSRPLVRRAVRSRVRPLAVIDLSVPRNVDPSVSQESGVVLLDLDDLGAQQPGTAAEGSDLAAAERAASEAAQTYLGQLRTRRAGPLITELRTRLEAICLDRLRDSLRGTAGTTLTDEALEHTAHAIAGAVAHSPTMLLRTAAGRSDESLLALLTDAFDLRTANDPA